MTSRTPILLLPQPQRLRRRPGRFALPPGLPLSLPPGVGRQELVAARQLAADLAAMKLETASARRAANADIAPPNAVALRFANVRGGDEAYRLTIKPAGVEILARTSRGLYYGLQTLRQLVRQFGKILPALEIADWPDLSLRGVYHDISRGRIPTVETLKYLIELLAHLKVNTFSLYMEYPFRYERHPQIWEDTDPLTAEDILELDAFCRDHGVDFIPSQASFGHLERLLSKPPYRHLANTTPNSLAGSRSNPRTGCSLDPTNPASLKLLSELYDELLPQFSSSYFNACCDEVWDLGQGKSAARAARVGSGRLFADFIKGIHRLTSRHGKRLMIWADILKHHPDAARAIPRDVMFLNWWYVQDRAQEWLIDHSRAIRDSGHDLVVCPGVNNWGSFMPRTSVMRANIRDFAASGRRFGAVGLLNTEWGDGGHYNLLATALPGFASGADHAWSHARADESTIARRWPLHVLGDRSGEAEKIITLAEVPDRPYGGGIFTGFGDERNIDFNLLKTTPKELLGRQLQFQDRLLEACRLADQLANRLDGPAALAAAEYSTLSRLTLAKGAAVTARLLALLGRPEQARRHYRAAADSTAALLPLFRHLWLLRNRPSELAWPLARFQAALRRWRRAAK